MHRDAFCSPSGQTTFFRERYPLTVNHGLTTPRVTFVASAVMLSALLLLLAGWWAPGCSESSASTPMGAVTSHAASGRPPETTNSHSPPDVSASVPPGPPSGGPIPAGALTTLANMTLEQKAAQVLLLTFDGESLVPATRDLLETYPPGGLLLLGPNIGDMNQLRDLTAALQRSVATVGAPGLFIAVDQEGGIVRRVTAGVPSLPSARSLGSDSSPEVARALALMTGVGLRAQGVNMVLAPVADVVNDPESFLYERTYGGTPGLVSSFVEAVSYGYVSAGLIAVVKHFPGHGSAPGDSHYGTPVSDLAAYHYRLIHLAPFRAAFAAGAEGVMMGHFVANAFDPDRPVSLSAPVIHGLLREELGFSGLVVSDDLEMGGATGNRTGLGDRASISELKAAAVAALEAGCDLLISTGRPDRQSALRTGIVDAVRSGVLPESRLDEAVLRILTLKLRHSIPIGT